MNQAMLIAKLQSLMTQLRPPVNAGLQSRLEFLWQIRQLQNLYSILSDEQTTLTERLEEFLRVNWQLTKGTFLCYTAQPDALLTDILLDVANFIHPTNPIRALMPGLSTTSLHDSYPDLDDVTREQLHSVLKTHCFSGDRNYLLPVHLLMNLELPPALNDHIPNPYHPAGAYLTLADISRLQKHSALTEALFEARQHYELVSANSSSLWSQLQQLCADLSINGGHGGRGTQDNAASGAYPAIIAFGEFYARIPNEMKTAIPPALLSQIQLLLNLSSDPTANPNATSNLNTCIATRRIEIMNAMQGHDRLLSTLRMTEADQLVLLNEALARVEMSKRMLQEALSKPTYVGFDKQPITRSLLTHVGLNWSIQSEQDVQALTQLTATEITELLQDSAFRNGICAQWRSLNDLVIFVMETANEKLPPFFQMLTSHLNNLLSTPQRVANLLISLQIDKITTLTPFFRTQLHDIPKLCVVLFAVTPQQRRALFEVIKNWQEHPVNQLPTLVGIIEYHRNKRIIQPLVASLRDFLTHQLPTAKAFALFFKRLSAISSPVVFSQLQEHLVGLINNIDDLGMVFDALTQKQRVELIISMAGRLPIFVENIGDFWRILLLLNPDNGKLLVPPSLNVCLRKLLQSNDDLIKALQACGLRQRSAILSWLFESEQPADYLPLLIPNNQSLVHLFNVLGYEECALVRFVKSHLKILVKTPNDLTHLYNSVSPGKCVMLLTALEEQLPQLIDSAEALNASLRMLDIASCERLMQSIQTNFFLHMVNTIDKLHFLLSSLACKYRRNAVLSVLPIAHVVNLIGNRVDAKKIFKLLSIEQSDALIKWVLENVRYSHQGYCQINAIFLAANDTQREALFDAIKNFLSGENDIQLLIHFLKILNEPERAEFLAVHQARLVLLLRYPRDLLGIAQCLNAEQRAALVSNINLHDPNWYNSTASFAGLIALLDETRCQGLFAHLGNELLQILPNSQTLRMVLSRLSKEKCCLLLMVMFDYLPGLIDNAMILQQILLAFDPAFRSSVMQSLSNDRLRDLIKSTADFAAIAEYLDDSDQCDLLDAASNNLIDFVTSSETAAQVFQYLHYDLQRDGFTLLKTRLDEVIQSVDDFLNILRFLSPSESNTFVISWQAKICDWTTHALHVGYRCRHLNIHQYAAYLAAIQPKLPSLLATPSDLSDALRFLDAARCRHLLATLRDHLPQVIPDADALRLVLYRLNSEQGQALTESLPAEFGQLIEAKETPVRGPYSFAA